MPHVMKTCVNLNLKGPHQYFFSVKQTVTSTPEYESTSADSITQQRINKKNHLNFRKVVFIYSFYFIIVGIYCC